MKSKGVTTKVIQHKLAMRIVQNIEITFENVFIPSENKLPKAEDFQKSTGKILLYSRVFVAWLTVGLCLGVYDNVAKYI
jgi:alkylation response protein AidB-like acyl-CoA dehydrogenase